MDSGPTYEVYRRDSFHAPSPHTHVRGATLDTLNLALTSRSRNKFRFQNWSQDYIYHQTWQVVGGYSRNGEEHCQSFTNWGNIRCGSCLDYSLGGAIRQRVSIHTWTFNTFMLTAGAGTERWTRFGWSYLAPFAMLLSTISPAGSMIYSSLCETIHGAFLMSRNFLNLESKLPPSLYMENAKLA